MKIEILDELDLSQPGRQSKYRWLYEKIDKLEPGQTLSLEDETYHDIKKHTEAVRRMYKKEVDERSLTLKTRSYGVKGELSPTLFITREY